MHSIVNVEKFGIVNRTDVDGLIYCEASKYKHIPPEFHIPAIKTATRNITISSIFDDQKIIDIRTADDRLRLIENSILVQSKILADSTTSLKSKLHNTNSTFDIFKEKVETNVAEMPEEIISTVKSIFMPFLIPLAGIALTALALYCGTLCCFKYCRRSIFGNEQARTIYIPGPPVGTLTTDESTV